MITIRKSEERGHFDFGWLNTYHTFSFDQYYDPRFMAFRSLRVINEDRVQAGHGFPTHGHRDMEIITYVLEGALEHKDSMGTGSVIRPGDVQKMSAGTGVRHSEANPSQDEPVHLLQIWIMPDTEGIKPDYQQKRFETEEKRGRLRLVASPDGEDDSITIQQDARVYASLLEPSQQVVHELKPNRHAWIQVARGAVEVNEQTLNQGDGAAISNESQVTIEGLEPSEILLFDLA
ncbi:MAG: quercetin 2,3-dioxygenase [Acidobacteriota bacterium]|jgi:redox-sensitive bicupin YhaK (pirin superfamily)|nr:quercetin 2,3-dioxygenase [Acidobacteriota bacterium]